MAEGFVKLARCLLDKPIFQNEKLLKVWIWCLMKATHKEHMQLVGLQKVPLLSGQFIFGRKKAAEELKMPPSTVWRFVTFLKDNQSLDIKTNNKFSLISIVNWELYQVEMFKTDSKKDNKKTTDGQQMDTNKNVKNVKNELLKDYITTPELFESINAFVEMRTKIKRPMTDRALKMMLNELDKLSHNEQEKIEILNQSTMNCWQGIFELKNKRGGNNNGTNKQPDSKVSDTRKYETEGYGNFFK